MSEEPDEVARWKGDADMVPQFRVAQMDTSQPTDQPPRILELALVFQIFLSTHFSIGEGHIERRKEV